MKKILFLIMIISVFLLMCSQVFAITFSDVSDDAWYKEYVYDLSEKGVINGFPDGTYKPDDKVNVGSFLKLIITATVGDNINYDLVDTFYGHWAEQYLVVARNYEVLGINEYSIEDLDREISRREIVKILARCDMMISKNMQQGSSKTFTDTNGLSAEEHLYLQHAIGIGVINGDPEGTFRPNDGLKRSECAKVIYTYVNREI